MKKELELDYTFNLDSKNRFTAWLGGEAITVDMADFADHLQNIGMIDEYATDGEGMILTKACGGRGKNFAYTSRGRFAYTFQGFMDEFGNRPVFNKQLLFFINIRP